MRGKARGHAESTGRATVTSSARPATETPCSRRRPRQARGTGTHPPPREGPWAVTGVRGRHTPSIGSSLRKRNDKRGLREASESWSADHTATWRRGFGRGGLPQQGSPLASARLPGVRASRANARVFPEFWVFPAELVNEESRVPVAASLEASTPPDELW